MEEEGLKITGSRSQIKVEIGDKVMLVTGELTVTPVFYADRSSVKSWEEPHHTIILTEEDKEALISRIISESRNSEVPVLFD